jgi:lysophospholipase L1-like esterase
VSAVVALGAAELALRIMPPSRGYSTLPPGTEWTLTPLPGVIHGVEGVSHVRVNRFGVRGRLFGDDAAEYRILAVGGSTTLCRALDDTKVWTHLVEADLGRTVDGRAVWVGNVGRDGSTSRDHVLQVKYLLRQYPRVDAVVSLVGVNDLISALQQGWHYRLGAPVTESGAEHEQMQRAFAQLPGRLQDQAAYLTGPVPWYKATALWQLGRRAKRALGRGRAIALRNAGVRSLQTARLERQNAAPWIDSVPPLDAPLIEYRRNLNAMADLAAAAGARLVLVTQPSAWREGMSDVEERLMLMGSLAGGRAYFTTRVLSGAMARYNATLLEVCRARGLECVDAAHLIPKDTTALYDDVHFNERGSRLLAEALAEHFRTRAPFP